MNHKNLIAIPVLVIIIGGAVIFGRHNPKPTPPPNPNSGCHIIVETGGVLPDSHCTPGSLNTTVTQANIQTTICKSGWTSTIRPPQTYTYPLKVQSIKDYGYGDTTIQHYEEDHFIPLELGGSPVDIRNLWAEPGASPNKKDGIEGLLRQRVCSGKITLVEAQREISTDWTKIK